MNFHKTSPVDLLKHHNVGGIVALPPTSCPRAARSIACAAAHVERTGSSRGCHSQQIGPMRWKNEIHRICLEERLQ